MATANKPKATPKYTVSYDVHMPPKSDPKAKEKYDNTRQAVVDAIKASGTAAKKLESVYLVVSPHEYDEYKERLFKLINAKLKPYKGVITKFKIYVARTGKNQTYTFTPK